MKMLVLGLLLSTTPFTPAATPTATKALCGPNQPNRLFVYYESPGGPECGYTYRYCNLPTFQVHEGCTTQYFSQYSLCQCQ